MDVTVGASPLVHNHLVAGTVTVTATIIGLDAPKGGLGRTVEGGAERMALVLPRAVGVGAEDVPPARRQDEQRALPPGHVAEEGLERVPVPRQAVQSPPAAVPDRRGEDVERDRPPLRGRQYVLGGVGFGFDDHLQR